MGDLIFSLEEKLGTSSINLDNEVSEATSAVHHLCAGSFVSLGNVGIGKSLVDNNT